MTQFILADCNNFFVSCERLFNPKLEGRPVIVISSNDGCVVSRSQEAKTLGIKMGEPYFQIKELCRCKRVEVFSSNFPLYSDLSGRVMQLLCEEAEEIELYSIDEAFLKFSTGNDLYPFAKKLREKIWKWLGIPISMGIGSTKVRAKIAADFAKKESGVFSLDDDQLLKDFPVQEIWGIGRATAKRLHALGIDTALSLQRADPAHIRRELGVVGERLVWELRGISCLDLVDESPKASIICSRSFGKKVTDLDELLEAVSTFVSNASVKLRDQLSVASTLVVFLQGLSFYQKISPLFPPTNDTPCFIEAAKGMIRALFSARETYKRCGVILQHLSDESPSLFANPKRQALMQVFDEVNAQFGRGTLFFGAAGGKQSWKGRCEHSSQRYTTVWDEIPTCSPTLSATTRSRSSPAADKSRGNASPKGSSDSGKIS